MIVNVIKQASGAARRVSSWVRDHLVSDVAEHSAVCEFDCSKLKCTHGAWESCVRRLEPITTTDSDEATQ